MCYVGSCSPRPRLKWGSNSFFLELTVAIRECVGLERPRSHVPLLLFSLVLSYSRSIPALSDFMSCPKICRVPVLENGQK